MAMIHTQLFDTADGLRAGMAAPWARECGALVLLSLGLEQADLARIAAAVSPDTAVLLADCYGIVGFAAEANRNLELLEAGRGKEYGGVGGDGGRGVVAVAFARGTVAVSTAAPPSEDASLHLVVASQGGDVGSFLRQHATAPYCGGIAKATFQYSVDERAFQVVPYFVVSELQSPDRSVGATSFTADVEAAVRALLARKPADASVEAVALFPCFMRGKNEYGDNDVEPAAVSALLPGVPIYGMFCHGELGPRSNLGFDSTEPPQRSCGQHSMTTIVAVHAAR